MPPEPVTPGRLIDVFSIFSAIPLPVTLLMSFTVVPEARSHRFTLRLNLSSAQVSLSIVLTPIVLNSNLFCISKTDVHSQKPLLIFINPHSGKGKAVRLFDKRVRSILEDCKIKHQIFITKHARHATEYIKTTPNIGDNFSALCTLSGDGLLWEVINGFVESVEQQTAELRAIPLPIGEFSLSYIQIAYLIFA